MSDTDSRLKDLYPFLHDTQKDPGREKKALLESVKQKSRESVIAKDAFYQRYAEDVIAAARAIAGVYRDGGRMFSMGNGGSSCDASHFAVEFQHPVTAGRPALPAINLVTDFAMISAVSNDLGVEHVFVRQLEAHARPGDGLVGFSTSGNSANLMAAFRKAKALGLTTLGLAGGNGGAMKSSDLLDHCLVVETDSIHRVQEVHVSIYHILWDLTHTLLADFRGSRPHPNPSPPGEGHGSTRPEEKGTGSPLPTGEGSGVQLPSTGSPLPAGEGSGVRGTPSEPPRDPPS